MKLNSVLVMVAAAVALAAPAMAKDKTIIWAPNAPVEFLTTATAVTEVPAGQPMAGMHLTVKVENRTLDVYIAPMDFCKKFGVKVEKGDEVLIVGQLVAGKAGEPDTVLAREISTGERNSKSGVFHPTLTVYLRNDDGPFWVEPMIMPATGR